MTPFHFALAAAALATAPSVHAQTGRSLPVNTMVVVTPVTEISSKHVEVDEKVRFRVASDVAQNGAVVIPAGTPVLGDVTFKTGRAVGGKSGKFEVRFDALDLNGRSYELHGTHRQEGKGNTAAALLASLVISGRSAVMTEGQTVNAFTDEPIAY